MQKKHVSLVMEMKEHRLKKYSVSFSLHGNAWPASPAHTRSESASFLRKKKRIFWSNRRLCSSLFHPSKPHGFAFKLCASSSLAALCHTSVLISPGPGGCGLGADCKPQRGPLRDLARALASWLQSRHRQRRTVRCGGQQTGPKAACQLCQDDRQAVGCRLNREGEHCVLYLFILSAGGGPDPPWPAARAVGRDGGRAAGERRAGKISGSVRGSASGYILITSKKRNTKQEGKKKKVNAFVSRFPLNC